MKTINKEYVEVINRRLGLNYSAKRYSKLQELKVLDIIPFDINSKKEIATIYKDRVFKKHINQRDLSAIIDDCMDLSVTELVIHMGKLKCPNLLEIDNIIVEILEEEVFNDSIVESYTCYINEASSYYLKDCKNNTLNIGADLVSSYRFCRCFMPKEINSSIEDELEKLSAILNIDELRLKSINEGNYYTILLDDKPIGVWSLDLMNNFSEESHDFYQAEHHDEANCFNCIDETYCKYKDETVALERKLISDELNKPIFSILGLLEALNKEVIEKE